MDVLLNPNEGIGELAAFEPKANAFEGGALVVDVLVTDGVEEIVVLADTAPNPNKDGVLDGAA